MYFVLQGIKTFIYLCAIKNMKNKKSRDNNQPFGTSLRYKR